MGRKKSLPLRIPHPRVCPEGCPSGRVLCRRVEREGGHLIRCCPRGRGLSGGAWTGNSCRVCERGRSPRSGGRGEGVIRRAGGRGRRRRLGRRNRPGLWRRSCHRAAAGRTGEGHRRGNGPCPRASRHHGHGLASPAGVTLLSWWRHVPRSRFGSATLLFRGAAASCADAAHSSVGGKPLAWRRRDLAPATARPRRLRDGLVRWRRGPRSVTPPGLASPESVPSPANAAVLACFFFAS